jgi:hypothetical protein
VKIWRHVRVQLKINGTAFGSIACVITTYGASESRSGRSIRIYGHKQGK